MLFQKRDRAWQSGFAARPQTRDRHGVGEVEAALPWHHGQAQALARAKLSQLRRQPARFWAKHQPVARLKRRVVHAARAARGQGKHAGGVGLGLAQKRSPVAVFDDLGVLVVVQPARRMSRSSMEKPSGSTKMQRAAGVGCQPDHVAGVGDFGLDKNNVEHPAIVVAAAPVPGFMR